jgi:hypothetical protein
MWSACELQLQWRGCIEFAIIMIIMMGLLLLQTQCKALQQWYEVGSHELPKVVEEGCDN